MHILYNYVKKKKKKIPMHKLQIPPIANSCNIKFSSTKQSKYQNFISYSFYIINIFHIMYI